MKQKIKFGLYGCNMYRTRDLLAGAQAAARDVVEVTASYDIDPAKANFAAKTYGGKAYRTEVEFLTASDVDVVLISLPAYLHADAFAHTARAGKDVYLEKPLCVNAAGRETVVRAAAEYPVRVYVGLSYRFVAPFRKVAEIVRRPDAGRLLGIHHHWLTSHIPEMKPEEMGWRHRMEQSGGQLNHHCCHVFDWFYSMGGDIGAVTATSYTQPGAPLPHEERELTACFQFRRGGMAVFNLSQDSHQYVQYGTVHMENLGIQYQWGKQTFVRVYKTRSRAADETYEWSLSNDLGDGGEIDRNALQMKDFISAYLAESPMPLGIVDGIRTYDIGCAVRESYRMGCRVALSENVI